MSNTKYIVELTRDEALVLVMSTRSGLDPSDGRLASAIYNIGKALLVADDSLEGDQFSLYERIGSPSYDVVDDGELLDEHGDAP